MKKDSFILAFLLSILIIVSCQKEDTSELAVIKQNNTAVSTHFIDDILVSEVEFYNNVSEMFLVEVHKPNSNFKSSSNEDEEAIEQRAYTSEEKYIEFGKEFGYEFDKQLILEKLMSDYALNSGAIAEFEKTGELPEWYLARELFVYDSLFSENSNLKSAQVSLFVTLFENHFVSGVGAGSSVIMTKTLPFMFPGWNNRVSCIEFVGIGGSIVIYDKTFYRDRISTILNWGMTHINLSTGVNDKMSSGILLF